MIAALVTHRRPNTSFQVLEAQHNTTALLLKRVHMCETLCFLYSPQLRYFPHRRSNKVCHPNSRSVDFPTRCSLCEEHHSGHDITQTVIMYLSYIASVSTKSQMTTNTWFEINLVFWRSLVEIEWVSSNQSHGFPTIALRSSTQPSIPSALILDNCYNSLYSRTQESCKQTKKWTTVFTHWISQYKQRHSSPDERVEGSHASISTEAEV